MPPSPVAQFMTHVGTLLQALLTRVTTPGTGIGETRASLLRTRLSEIAAAIRAILAAPFAGPRRTPKQPRPRFLACSRPVPDPRPARDPATRLPTHYRWLTKLFPEFLPDRHALEDRLRDQDVKDAIAADPRLAKAIRKLAWMLGVQRSLIPPARQRGQVFLVSDSNVAKARADYAEGLKTMTHEEIMRKWVKFPDDPWMRKARDVSRDKRHNHDKRPVWFGPDLKPPEFQPIPYPIRE